MKPLSKKQRSSSLGFLLTIFILAVPLLLAYSSGYRFDFEKMAFEKTGGVFIHSDLSGANVFIDEEYSESGGVFLKNILVQNLKANSTYKVRVEKEGYNNWYKDLFVYPNLVTESTILMLPKNLRITPINQFIFVPNTDPKIKATSTKITTTEYKDTLEIFTSTSTINKNDIVFETVVIKSTSTKSTSTKPLALKATSTIEKIVPDYLKGSVFEGIEDKKQLKQHNKMISWLEDGNIHIAWSGSYDSTPYFFCDPRGCRDKIIISLDTDITNFDFFPGRSDVFVVSTENNIFAVEADDRSTQNIQTIFEGKKPEFRLDSNTMFIKDGQELYYLEI